MSKDNILGFDQSLTESGWYYNNKNFGTIKPKNKGIKRLIEIRTELEKLFDGFDITHISMENYSFGSRYNREILGELGGVIKTLSYDLGIKIITVPTTVLKKYVTGKGNSKKEVMLLYVFKNYGFETKNNNIADAFSLKKIYKDYLRWKDKKEKFKKYEVECFERIENNLNT